MIKGYESLLLEERIDLEEKTTELEHTKHIGIIISPNLRFITSQFYENKIYTTLKLNERAIKTKKDFIYEYDYKS